MSEHEGILQAHSTHSVNSNLNATSETSFYAVHVPRDDNNSNAEDQLHVYMDKTEALKVMKKYKKCRFNTFKTQTEAEDFAQNGNDQLHSTTDGGQPQTTRAITEEKTSNFKGPKPQDLVRFRKMIENGDLEAVKSVAWENPRYLVSAVDTPAILQEGSRYNALHVATKVARTTDMCELILNTVGDTKFVQLLYGGEDPSLYEDRAEILLDLYLNTPDKGLNETPLHFAVKFGLKEVVQVLVSYPQCLKTLRNKYEQTPADIICSRKCQEDEMLKKEIHALLDEQFYVPVLRSEDNTLQPLIGQPFSPTSPPHLNVDPISPRIEVRAIAGPMSRNKAMEFRKKWKTPPRMCNTPTKRDHSLNESFSLMNSPTASSVMRLQDTEKGLERVGRDLAKEYNVSWKEYWPFLSTFTDLSSTEGLLRLEKFLKQRFNDIPALHIEQERNTMADINKRTQDIFNDINALCDKLSACSLDVGSNHMSNNFDSNLTSVQRRLFDDDSESEEDSEFFTPPSSPISSCSSSDDDMSVAEQGSFAFIQGDAPSKLDYAVMHAITSANIDTNSHPNIYRWRHQMKIVMECDPFRFENLQTPRRRLLLSPETPQRNMA